MPALLISAPSRVRPSGASLAAPASVALTREETALEFCAGPEGLQVLMLQYPCRA